MPRTKKTESTITEESISEHIKKVQNKEIDIVEYTEKAIEEAKKINSTYNYLNTISDKLAL
jgi:predicted nucleic acid-binding protein